MRTLFSILWQRKLYWLLPLAIIAIGLFALLALTPNPDANGTGFIYTIF